MVWAHILTDPTLATAEVAEDWRTSEGLGSFLSGLMDLKFYEGDDFTLTYTLPVTPWC